MSYRNTFIRVSEDCPVAEAELPKPRKKATVAELQHRELSRHPYELTEEQLYVRVHGLRLGLTESEIADRYDALRDELFARPQACMRASPLTKRYGFGVHYDPQGRLALHACDSESYAELAADSGVDQLAAMRSSRR